MCGILGYVGQQPEVDVFARTLEHLRHRGPDSKGLYKEPNIILGHRRLSVIDLSEAAHQPMVDPETGAVITYNGEIYNFIELRQELEGKGQTFRTKSDTEVLLRCMLQWGAKGLSKLNGMWAFAIWMPQKKKLFLARDRFGVKPLYYVIGKEYFAFSSEPKGLLGLLPQYRLVDKITLYEFLALGHLYVSGASFYQGIKVLLPAHYMEYTMPSADLTISRYWDYPQWSSNEGNLSKESEEFVELFRDAVNIRLRSDVPLGISLSGGLDSTSILAASKQLSSRNMTCYTSVYGDGERGEAEWATRAAAEYQTVPIEVSAPAGSWLETLQDIVWHMDGPGYSPAVFPLWHLMAKARQGDTVVMLDGQGGDEALGGYLQHSILNFQHLFIRALRNPSVISIQAVSNAWAGLLRSFPTLKVFLRLLRETFPFLIPYYRRYVGGLSVLKADFLSEVEGKVPYFTNNSAPIHMDQVTKRLWCEHVRDILPGLLHYGDAISMAHGIEVRNPFLDFRLVEWLFSRSAGIKIVNGQSKWLLRQFLRGAGHKDIADRWEKIGYPTPADTWLAMNDGKIPREVLLSRGALIHEYCEPSKIKRLIDYHVSGKAGAGNHLYRLLSTELWLKRCMVSTSV